MPGKQVLIIEDDPKTTHLIRVYLENDGYSVTASADGYDGLDRARSIEPDLVVLDLMLPSLDGLTVCRRLRESANPFVIMVTARSTEGDILRGLDAGADDYIVKPFSPRELVARVHAVLKRLPEESFLHGHTNLSAGALKLNVENRTLTSHDEPIYLTAIEFRLLALLMGEPGRVFSRNQLVASVYGNLYEGLDRSIDVHVMKLRRKLGLPQCGQYIETVYGSGYRFAEQPM
jgi:DNA-binding response OmpR family regulator